jgi:hypothetical protein
MKKPVGRFWIKHLRGPLWLWLLSALNAAAVLALILFVLAKISVTMYWVSDGVVVLWCIAVFGLTPIGVGAVLILRRRTLKEQSLGPKYYARCSYIFLTVAWLCLAPISLFWGAIYIHLWEPWPLSLAQGPDNDRAMSGFKRLLGFHPDHSVHSIYYRVISFRDSSHFLRFNYSDQKILERIILSLDLVAMDADTRARRRITYLGEDDTMAHWWTAEEISSATKVYIDRHMGENFSKPRNQRTPMGLMKILWIDEARQIAYFTFHTF